jgi:hypothetical protein
MKLTGTLSSPPSSGLANGSVALIVLVPLRAVGVSEGAQNRIDHAERATHGAMQLYFTVRSPAWALTSPPRRKRPCTVGDTTELLPTESTGRANVWTRARQGQRQLLRLEGGKATQNRTLVAPSVVDSLNLFCGMFVSCTVGFSGAALGAQLASVTPSCINGCVPSAVWIATLAHGRLQLLCRGYAQ